MPYRRGLASVITSFTSVLILSAFAVGCETINAHLVSSSGPVYTQPSDQSVPEGRTRLLLYTGITGEKACQGYFDAVFALQQSDVFKFLQPGVDAIARELNMQQAATITLTGMSLEDAKAVFTSRASDPSGWRQRFFKEHPNLHPRQLDENGYPILQFHIILKPSPAMLAGSDPRARRLLDVEADEQARYEANGDYTLQFDPPLFKHTVDLNIRGYRGSPKLEPERFHATTLGSERLRNWTADLGSQLATRYNAVLTAGLRDPMYTAMYGTASIERLANAVVSHAAEISQLATRCRNTMMNVKPSGTSRTQ